MGSSSVPSAVDPNTILFGNEGSWYNPMTGQTMKTGTKGMFNKDLYKQFENQALNGLDPKQRAMLEGSAAGSLRSGEQNQREMFASMGNAPVAAQVGAQTNLRSGINKNLLNALTEGDINAKQAGVSNIMSTLGLGMQGAGMQNQYNMQKYQLDNQPGFWEGLLQSLISGGSNVLGAYLGKG